MGKILSFYGPSLAQVAEGGDGGECHRASDAHEIQVPWGFLGRGEPRNVRRIQPWRQARKSDPICSMVLEYLPTFARTKSPSFVGKYTIHGAYGDEMR